MDNPRVPRFGLGIYWPDDYTDYLVHFHEPFEVFRLELDREGPMIFWVAPDSPYETMSDETFETFARAARRHLGIEEIVELGTSRQVDLRVTEVPFPPILMVSNREEKFHAIVGLGAEPFTAVLSADEAEPLIADVDLHFESQSPGIGNELSEYAESFYNEFYDRQDFLDKKGDPQQPGQGGTGGRERRGGDHDRFSRN
jgi:hypothetical protein